MYLVINNDHEHMFAVQGISREMIPNAAGNKQFFIRVIADEKINATLEYCATFVATDIVNMQLFSKDNDENTLISSYDLIGRVNSIHEVVENNSQEITVIIDY